MMDKCPRCLQPLALTPDRTGEANCPQGHAFTISQLITVKPATTDDEAVQRAASLIKRSRL